MHALYAVRAQPHSAGDTLALLHPSPTHSFVCDELDGRAARTFNQASTLGALLDMVTDRVATTGLLAILCAFYPAWSLAFLVLLMLDIFSHWFQMYSTLLAGSVTHKVGEQHAPECSQARSWTV